MEMQVVVERVEGNGYLARTPFGWSAEGATPEEAVLNLQRETDRRLADGMTMRVITVPNGGHPYAPLIGSLKGHPALDEWREAMAEYRRQVESDPDRL